MKIRSLGLSFKKRPERISSAGNAGVETQLVDGGVVLIPNERMWDRLLKGAEIDGLSVGAPNIQKLLRWRLEFCKPHAPRFLLCLYKLGPHAKSWGHCVLFRIGERWQRVHIEHLQCGHCGWHGDAANPHLAELYIGVPDKKRAWQEARKLPILPCPKCGDSLPPRTPIWVDTTDLDLQASRAQLVTVLRKPPLAKKL
jgi:hypothetical protein